MIDYVSSAELEAFMSTTLDPDTSAFAIASAEATVRNYLQQEITLHLDDVEYRAGTGKFVLRLRERPVRAVSQVTEDETVLDPSSWKVRKAVVIRTDGTSFLTGSEYAVTYDHGWDVLADVSEGQLMPVPPDIRRITLQVARRSIANEGVQDVAILQSKSETIGSYSYTNAFNVDQSIRAISLLEGEKEVLDWYVVRLAV